MADYAEKSKSTLSTNLEKLRKSKGYTQQQLADMLNLNRTTYTKYETGVSEPSIDVLKQLADCLGVDMNYLLYHKSDVGAADSGKTLLPLSREELEILRIIRSMSEKEKAGLRKYAEDIKKKRKNS